MQNTGSPTPDQDSKPSRVERDPLPVVAVILILLAMIGIALGLAGAFNPS